MHRVVPMVAAIVTLITVAVAGGRVVAARSTPAVERGPVADAIPSSPSIAAPTRRSNRPAREASATSPDQRLREAIVSHEAQMKICVERQLKRTPKLNASGTFVLDVNRTGRVTKSKLQGPALEGTPLEGCLRKLASAWRFPRTGHPYTVEAPLEVAGAPPPAK